MIHPQIRFTGLVELRKAMRDAEAGSQKHLQVHFKQVATIVASAIAGRVPQITGATAATVRPQATATSASIVAGGPKAPGFPWLDFGGKRPRDTVERPFSKKGRYIYPTIGEMSDVIVNAADEGIGDALKEAGWKRG